MNGAVSPEGLASALIGLQAVQVVIVPARRRPWYFSALFFP